VKPLLTKSRLACARKCKRRHQLEYELGYRPVEDEETLRFGTAIHKALERWWNEGSWAPDSGAHAGAIEPDTRLANALEQLADVADPYLRVKAEAMMTAYHLRWLDEPFEVLGVEVEFRAPLRNPATGALSRTWDLGGKLDVRVRDLRDGLVKFIEHKTASEDISPGSKYFKRLRMDTQVSVYFEGCGTLGEAPASCIYDVLGKPGQRPGNVPLVDDDGVKIVLDREGQRVRTKDGKKWRQTGDEDAGYVLQTRPETPGEYRTRVAEVIASEPDAYLVRTEVVRLEAEMAEALGDTWMLGQEIRGAQLSGQWPRNPDACVTPFGTCPFFAACSKEASLEDASKYRRITQKHPELSTEEGAAP
jgi:hypothetical protein